MRRIASSIVLGVSIASVTSCRAQSPDSPMRAGTEMVRTDPGVPRVLWAGPRSIRVLGRNVVLNGFRRGGHYSDMAGPLRRLDTTDGLYSFDDHLTGVSAPNLGPDFPEVWVAVFAVETRGDAATIAFVPFLRVTRFDPASRRAWFDSRSGTLEPTAFRNRSVLVCQEDGAFSWRVVDATDNSAEALTLRSAGTRLAPGDFLLPAPARSRRFKYLCSLKLDYSPAVGGRTRGEWRNFTISQGRTQSYVGNPFGDIRSPNLRELRFTGHVSPLATGVFGSAQAYLLSSGGGPAYFYLSHDAANHVIASVGSDRTSGWGDGGSTPITAAFGERQSLWGAVNSAEAVGRFVIQGWTEE